MEVGYRWRPIKPPESPEALAAKELRPFISLWRTEKKRLEKTGALARFSERLARRWAIETGVVERVYDLSMGVTMTLVEQGFAASLVAHGETNLAPEELVAILQDHRESLHMVMDVVGGARQLSVGWIKELHALLTSHQGTTKAITPAGAVVEVPLIRGDFKKLPNNPRRPDGKLHEYCPPEHVAQEMDRLVELYGGLPADLPDVRAAWLHHAFTQIHPFQDGNGRVARALASIDFIKAELFPVLVDRSDFQRIYLPALEAADEGNLQSLVQYFADCEQRMLVKAISEADSLVAAADSVAAVLAAARQKVAFQRGLGAAPRREMRKRVDPLLTEATRLLQDAAKKVRDIPNVTAVLKRSGARNAHYYRSQVLAFAKNHSYWADLREQRAWVRLQLRDGGVTDLVVSLHFAGNPSPGVMVGALFLVHRAGEPTGPGKSRSKSPAARTREASGVELETAPVTLLGVEPLLLPPDEGIEEQRLRLSKWLDGGLVAALAQWTRYL